MDSDQPDALRLNKYLALQLGISRREADEYIAKGKVRINDVPAVLGARITPTDIVTVQGRTLGPPARYVYLLFHKPAGYVSSRRAQGETLTIYSLLPSEYHVLKPVGRLDKDSSGILLLTNNGDFAYRMTHPKFAKTKIYHVQLDFSLQPLHQQMISDYGVQLEDGVSKFMIEKEETHAQHEDAARASYIITMHEGRNRQIRRTFRALGYSVTHLHRTQFGDYSLGDIPPGSYKILDIP